MIPLFSGLHWFWWEVSAYFYFSPVITYPFKNILFCFIVVLSNWMMIWLEIVFSVLILLGICSDFWGLQLLFFITFGKSLVIISSMYFSFPVFLFFPFGIKITNVLDFLTWPYRSLRLYLFLKSFFKIWIIYFNRFSSLLNFSSAMAYLPLSPSR